ncbi:MAG: PqqD family protein [Acidobacteria bacterium]|nr:PqqD family protein [Acidobacteriota bacterium]
MPELTLDSVVAATSRQLSCKLGEEAVIMALADGVYYGLNETGALVWDLLRTPREVREIVAAVVENYDAAESVAAGDVLRLLGDMAARGLIDVRH